MAGISVPARVITTSPWRSETMAAVRESSAEATEATEATRARRARRARTRGRPALLGRTTGEGRRRRRPPKKRAKEEGRMEEGRASAVSGRVPMPERTGAGGVGSVRLGTRAG